MDKNEKNFTTTYEIEEVKRSASEAGFSTHAIL